MGKPAARVGDMTSHGGMIVSGSTNVFMGGMLAANAMSMHVCPMATPGTPPVPHGGGPAIPMGALNVLINGLPAIVLGDMFICVGPPACVAMGCFTVLIGMNSGGGAGGGGGSSSPQAKAGEALKAGKVSPVEGTEAYPIEIQAQALVMQEYCTPQGQKLDLAVIDAMAGGYEQQKKAEEELKGITIRQIVEKLKALEAEDGKTAARFFARHLNITVLNNKAKAFIDGTDSNADNDPNIMPTRFMILWGADDAKLQEIDTHPQDSEHKITIANLRKALRAIGYDIAEQGAYDDDLHRAVVRFSAWALGGRKAEQTHTVAEGEDLGTIAYDYRLLSWDYLYECNKEKIGDDPATLEPGTELDIPQWDSTSGDEKLAELGINPASLVGGVTFVYPWTLYSCSPKAMYADESEQQSTEQQQQSDKKTFEVLHAKTGEVLNSAQAESIETLRVLIPTSAEIKLREVAQ